MCVKDRPSSHTPDPERRTPEHIKWMKTFSKSKDRSEKGKHEVRGKKTRQSSGAGTHQSRENHLALDWRRCQPVQESWLVIGCSQSPAQVSLMRVTDGERGRECVSVCVSGENKNKAADAGNPGVSPRWCLWHYTKQLLLDIRCVLDFNDWWLPIFSLTR